MSNLKLFLTGDNGPLELVEVIGKSNYIKDGIYIRYLNGGGTDTTTKKWLKDIPEGLEPTKKNFIAKHNTTDWADGL